MSGFSSSGPRVAISASVSAGVRRPCPHSDRSQAALSASRSVGESRSSAPSGAAFFDLLGFLCLSVTRRTLHAGEPAAENRQRDVTESAQDKRWNEPEP